MQKLYEIAVNWDFSALSLFTSLEVSRAHTRVRAHTFYFICCDTPKCLSVCQQSLSTVWKCCLLLLCHQFYLFMNIGGRRILQWVVVYANWPTSRWRAATTGGNGNVSDRNQLKSKMRNAITSRIVSNEKFVRVSFHWHCRCEGDVFSVNYRKILKTSALLTLWLCTLLCACGAQLAQAGKRENGMRMATAIYFEPAALQVMQERSVSWTLIIYL